MNYFSLNYFLDKIDPNYMPEEIPSTPYIPMKRCSKCGKWKLLTEFGKRKEAKDGLKYKCKECFREYNRKRYLRKNPAAKELHDHSQTPEGFKYCLKCRTEKPLTEFNKERRSMDGLASLCRECIKKYTRKRYLRKNPAAKELYDRSQTPEGFKYCLKCRTEKPLTEFGKRKREKDGAYWCCKNCMAKANAIRNIEMKEKAIAIHLGKCQNKKCPYPDINTDSKYLEFHHKDKYSGGARKEGGRQTLRRIIKNGIQDDLELLCAPCHTRADIRDETHIKGRKRKLNGD